MLVECLAIAAGCKLVSWLAGKPVTKAELAAGEAAGWGNETTEQRRLLEKRGKRWGIERGEKWYEDE